MEEDQPEQDRLFEEAMDLIIRFQNDPSNPLVRDMIRQWHARGADYEAAWAEVSEIHGMTGKVVSERRAVSGKKRPLQNRRIFMVGAALMGVGAVGSRYIDTPEFLIRAGADYTTKAAETRNIILPDGTFATLGPDSAMSMQFDRDHRLVRILAGMAFFDAVQPAPQPLRVSTYELVTTTREASFEISAETQFSSVNVESGSLTVNVLQNDTTPELKLETGEWLRTDRDAQSFQRGAMAAGKTASWRKGQIFAENETVASIVNKIARWQAGRILIVEPGFGRNRVSGVFDVSSPVRALEAVVHPFGGRVYNVSQYLTLITAG